MSFQNKKKKTSSFSFSISSGFSLSFPILHFQIKLLFRAPCLRFKPPSSRLLTPKASLRSLLMLSFFLFSISILSFGCEISLISSVKFTPFLLLLSSFLSRLQYFASSLIQSESRPHFSEEDLQNHSSLLCSVLSSSLPQDHPSILSSPSFPASVQQRATRKRQKQD